MSSISIVGRACRLPGARDVDAYWQLLEQQRCSVSAVPEERFVQSWYRNERRGEPGKAYTFAAGVIDDIWGFDPGAFAITPREARQMDPQQRLILQLVWEALEDACVPPSTLARRDVGVYMGASSMDHSHRQYFDPAGTDSYLMTGNTLSLISNRVSYVLDLCGPSLTIDTACSSSLVALDYAVQDLKRGRIDTAIVGGVNTLLSPFNFMGFCAASMLSPDGLCRPFDHRANGYVRSEGGVVIVLKRDDAELVSRRPCASIVASSMNSDGRTSGIALPSFEQQAHLLSTLYAEHGVDPDRLAFVEAHGTGTMVGDPAEAKGIGLALGVKRSRPLPIGSAKSNVGHLEPASGLVGLLKAQLSLEHGVYPATLHVEKLNPHIPFDELNISVATAPVKLETGGTEPALAGINNFGFGGTNVHVVIAGAARPPPKTRDGVKGLTIVTGAVDAARDDDRAPTPLMMLSAHCPRALKALAERYQARATTNRRAADVPSFVQLANATAYRRDRLRERLVITGDSDDAFAAGLAAHIAGIAAPNVIATAAVARAAKTAFVFSGNGSQWEGMGRAAFAHSSAFREHFRAVDQCYTALTRVSLERLLFADDLIEQLQCTEVAQPLLFALQIALARALIEQGIRPDAVVGHSVGEVAAAHIAGALDLAQAVGVISARSRHQETARGLGRMAAVRLGLSEAEILIAESGLKTLEVAAINSPRSTTISGETQDVLGFMDIAKAQKIAATLLDVDYPFHSARLDPVRTPLAVSLEGLTPNESELTFYSTVCGDAVGGSTLDADYWWRNVRDPVQFEEAVRSAARDGMQVFIEIGPRVILRNAISEIVADTDAETHVLSSFEQDEAGDWDPVRSCVARAIAAGARFDTVAVFGPQSSAAVALPHYPWQNEPYRLSPSSEALSTFDTTQRQHPLLGMQLRPDDYLWDRQLDTMVVPFLFDHKVGGKPIMPGTGYVEMALAAVRQVLKSDRIELRDIDFTQALELSAEASQELRTRAELESGTVAIASRVRLASDDRQTNMRARFARLPSEDVPEHVRPSHQTDALSAQPMDRIYRLAEKFGLDYGPAFRRLTACREIGDDTIEIELAAGNGKSADDPNGNAYILHPVDFDVCFHGLNVVYDRLLFGENKLAYVPVRIGLLRIYRAGARVRSARIELRSYNIRAVRADFQMFSADGALIAIAEDVQFRAAALVHRLGIRQAAYHIDKTIRPLPLDAHRSAGPGLKDVAMHASTAIELHLGCETLSENRLLLGVAAKRIAFDVLAGFADGERMIDLAAGEPQYMNGDTNGRTAAQDAGGRAASVVSETGLTTATGFLHMLADIGLAEPAGLRWQLAKECPLPPATEVIHTILRHDPMWSAECFMLLRAMRTLPAFLASSGANVERYDTGANAIHSSGVLEHFLGSSPSARAQIATVFDTLSAATADLGAHRALRVLLLGSSGSGITRALAALAAARNATLVVADTEASLIRRAESMWRHVPGLAAVHVTPRLEQLNEYGPFDFVVSANDLHRMRDCDTVIDALPSVLADGALVIISEFEPDAFYDIVFGARDGWFTTHAGFDRPRSLLRTADGWRRSLASAGLKIAKPRKAGDDASGRAGVSLLVGQQPAKKHRGAKARGTDIHAIDADEALIKPDPDAELPRGRAMIFADGVEHKKGFAATFARRLQSARFETIAVVAPDEAALEFIGRDGPCGPVELFYLTDGRPCPADDHMQALLRRTGNLTTLLKALGTRSVRLWIVAEGGARAIFNEGTPCPVQTGVWAFARTAMNEFPGLNIRLVDFADGLTPKLAADRLATLASERGEVREIVLTRDAVLELLVRCGVPAPHPVQAGETSGGAADQADSGTVLRISQLGNLDGLQWTTCARRAPLEDEVEIEVAATGLNFRDVMWSLGLLPEEALEDGFAGPTLGFECSGRVVRIGGRVNEFQPGDAVIAMAPACFGSHVTVTARAVAAAPRHLSLTDAATVSVAFLTAFYALDHLARLSKDEWVLIHGAAGGVGLAALQVAKRNGARVIATAGNDEKREVLTSLGADHVFDSRSLAFVDDVRRVTNGGVDVVLNSLAGEAMERSLELVRPFGRFLELGKRDFYANTKVGLRPFRRNVSYFGIDADQLLTHQPVLTKKLFKELLKGFEDGDFTGLPYRLFGSDEVVDAFRLMQKSGHIGKIVVEAPRPGSGEIEVVKEFQAASEGTHVIFGGMGGFGLEMAKWLVDRGARHIVLTSRRADAGEAGAEVCQQLRARGVDLQVVCSDVTDRASVEALLTELRGQRPISGIAHMAMVLDDGLIQNLTPERIERVLAPKVAGARHLDQLTKDDDLDYFILFSSAAALFGNPGQANYVAANGYLDGLARERRARGQRALAVAWGAITDVGVLARNAGTAQSLARHTGGRPFTARDGLNLLAHILVRDDTDASCVNITLAAMNWSMAGEVLDIMNSPTFELVRREAGRGTADVGRSDIRAAIAGLGDSEARAVVARYVAKEVAAIFRMPVEDISLKRSLSDLGMDSLMGLELHVAAEKNLGIKIPMIAVSDGTTINDMSGVILNRLRRGRAHDDADEQNAMIAQHIAEDLDAEDLKGIARQVEQHQAGLKRVVG